MPCHGLHLMLSSATVSVCRRSALRKAVAVEGRGAVENGGAHKRIKEAH